MNTEQVTINPFTVTAVLLLCRAKCPDTVQCMKRFINLQRYYSDDYESDPDLHTVTTLVSFINLKDFKSTFCYTCSQC